MLQMVLNGWNLFHLLYFICGAEPMHRTNILFLLILHILFPFSYINHIFFKSKLK